MTRIADLLAQGQTWSFEFCPPKTPEGMASFDEAGTALSRLDPNDVWVTYGPLGTTRDPARERVLRVNRGQSFPAIPRLPCVGHSRPQVLELLESYRDGGVE